MSILVVNTTNISVPSHHSFLPNAITIKTSNSSLFIQIQPENINTPLGYFIWIKYGSTPYYNQTYQNYDELKGFCARDLKSDNIDTYYQFFSSYGTNNSLNINVLVGFGIREMNNEENITYCTNSSYVNATLTP